MEKIIFFCSITIINKESFVWLPFSNNIILLNLKINLTNLKLTNIIYSKNSKDKFIFFNWISL